MSGIAALFRRDGARLPEGALASICQRLRHRGPDGERTVAAPGLRLAYLHLWSTPEERGERQPLQADDGTLLAFDGRIDNRVEIGSLLGLGDQHLAGLSDAELLLRGYLRWGGGLFARLLGAFAIVIHDPAQRRLLCARDPTGDRSLYHASSGGTFALASEPHALLALSGVSAGIDESSLARFFALQAPADGHTFFRAVHEIPPAHTLTVDGAQILRLDRFWEPSVAEWCGAHDDEYAEAFRFTLEESVRARLRAPSGVGVMMSGGFDSTSVAALAATTRREPPLAVSWVFDELPSCDERLFMDALGERYDLPAVRIPADTLWPLRNGSHFPINPGHPGENPYRLLKEEVYRQTAASGRRVLLTGGFGDHLYSGAEHWLLDTARDRGPLAVLRALLELLPVLGPTGCLHQPGVRALLRHWIPRHHPPPKPAPWLTPHARELIGLPESGRIGRLLGATTAASVAYEIFHASRCGIDLRHPYRDRRLIELALSLPAHQLYRAGRPKTVLRHAMREVLPPIILARHRPTSLLPLFRRGLLEKERSTAEDILGNPDALWRRFVRPDWIRSVFPAALRAAQDGAPTLIPWLCISAELWQRRIDSGQRIGEALQ